MEWRIASNAARPETVHLLRRTTRCDRPFVLTHATPVTKSGREELLFCHSESTHVPNPIWRRCQSEISPAEPHKAGGNEASTCSKKIIDLCGDLLAGPISEAPTKSVLRMHKLATRR